MESTVDPLWDVKYAPLSSVCYKHSLLAFLLACLLAFTMLLHTCMCIYIHVGVIFTFRIAFKMWRFPLWMAESLTPQAVGLSPELEKLEKLEP